MSIVGVNFSPMVRRRKRERGSTTPPRNILGLYVDRKEGSFLRAFQNIGNEPSFRGVVEGSDWKFEFIRKLMHS